MVKPYVLKPVPLRVVMRALTKTDAVTERPLAHCARPIAQHSDAQAKPVLRCRQSVPLALAAAGTWTCPVWIACGLTHARTATPAVALTFARCTSGDERCLADTGTP